MKVPGLKPALTESGEILEVDIPADIASAWYLPSAIIITNDEKSDSLLVDG